jgi:hypothetical protein
MKLRPSLLLLVGTILLVAGNLIWMSWNYHLSGRNSLGNKFKIVEFHTNGTIALEVFETSTGNPVWLQYMGVDGKPDTVGYFFQGRNVLNLSVKHGQRVDYDVVLYGPGKSLEWWWDHHSGTFNERMRYDTNGSICEWRRWYADEWRPVERRGKKNGVIIGGTWHHLVFDTNGNWTTNLSTGVIERQNDQ